MFWHNKKLYYNVHSQYNYYIDIDDMLIVKQKCIRFLTDVLKDIVTKNKAIIRDITEDSEKFVRLIKENIERECGTKETLKINKMWKKDYEKQGYKFYFKVRTKCAPINLRIYQFLSLRFIINSSTLVTLWHFI